MKKAKAFFYIVKNLFLSFLILVGIFGFIYFGLMIYTRHYQLIEVPDLVGTSFYESQEILKDKKLTYEVIDSTKFDSMYAPLTIINHNPKGFSFVKKKRKIYLVLNPSSLPKVKIPNIIQITKRNAESMLLASGLKIGRVTYRRNIGRNMVLEIRYDGKKILPGETLPQSSKIDLVLGNGRP